MMRITRTKPGALGCAALTLMLCLVPLRAGQKADPKKKVVKAGEESQAGAPLPGYHNTRFEENWSDIAPAQRKGWDALKAIPLDENGRFRFTVGGQARTRAEFWSNFAFSSDPARDDAFGLLRVRLHGDLDLGRHFRVFVEGMSALATGRTLPGGNRTLDTDSAEFQNALIDFRVPLEGSGSLTFRVGRQELQFGRQRLVSPLDWSNTRPRSFDGFRGIIKTGKWRADGFWTRYVRTRKYRFNNHDSGIDFYGLYAQGPLGKSKWSLDAYWLGFDADARTYLGRSGRERRQTLGARLSTQRQSFDLDLESAAQWGTFAGADIRAWMLASQLGRPFKDVRLSPRVYVGFDYSSGDDNPGDGQLGTFNQLFPLGHAYHGYADFVARQNTIDFNQGLSLVLYRNVTAKIEQHWFWRAQEQDALYNAGGGVARTGAPGSPGRVGSELDLTLAWKLSRHLNATSGYSRFFAGPFLRATGPSEDVNFSYIALQWTF